jgi:hypothetical protein
MSVNRKEFLKKACFAGACMCGFGLPLLAGSRQEVTGVEDDPGDDGKVFIQKWIANLLENMKKESDQSDMAAIIKKNAEVHFNDLEMHEMLADYIGKPEEFTRYIAEKWGWKVEFDKKSNTIIANENKAYCVCPVVNQASAVKPTLICNCSEGFAEMMFSVVFGSPVKATVVSSVLRGDKNCIYKIVSG